MSVVRCVVPIGEVPVVVTDGPFPFVVWVMRRRADCLDVLIAAAPPEHLWVAEADDGPGREGGAFVGAVEAPDDATDAEVQALIRQAMLEHREQGPFRMPPVPMVVAVEIGGVELVPEDSGGGSSSSGISEASCRIESVIPPDVVEVTVVVAFSGGN